MFHCFKFVHWYPIIQLPYRKDLNDIATQNICRPRCFWLFPWRFQCCSQDAYKNSLILIQFMKSILNPVSLSVPLCAAVCSEPYRAVRNRCVELQMYFVWIHIKLKHLYVSYFSYLIAFNIRYIRLWSASIIDYVLLNNFHWSVAWISFDLAAAGRSLYREIVFEEMLIFITYAHWRTVWNLPNLAVQIN
jgi:hypothetical protein